jgi:hypothetical protein
LEVFLGNKGEPNGPKNTVDRKIEFLRNQCPPHYVVAIIIDYSRDYQYQTHLLKLNRE